jgi:UDP-GlcNAc:undecaprenyl-phosphate GlcNAc-1-phosphate transferase
MQWISLISVFVVSTGLSYILVPIMKKLAFRYNVLDHPGYHKTHLNVYPLLGGGAIYAAFMIVILAGVVFMGMLKLEGFSGFPEYRKYLLNQMPVFIVALPRLFGLLIGGTVIFILGLIDDVRGVGFSYKLKFAIQGIAAVILVLSGIRIEFLSYGFLNMLVTILWVVGITNSFNLLDNMDGLSSGVALIISVILGILTIQQGQYFSALLLLTLAGSIIGFLRYNFHPSSIFMGDAGSLFIGYTLAALTVSNSYVTTRSVSQLPIVIPVLVLGVPLFDTFSVMVIRWREHRPLFVGDNCHFSHRLVELGMSVRQTVIFIYLVTLCVGLSAILISELSIWGSLLVVIQEGLVFGLITLLMIKGKQVQLLYHAVKHDLEKLHAGDKEKEKVLMQK